MIFFIRQFLRPVTVDDTQKIIPQDIIAGIPDTCDKESSRNLVLMQQRQYVLMIICKPVIERKTKIKFIAAETLLIKIIQRNDVIIFFIES